ncbi:MAG: hypothetical protein ABFR75_10375 [Acidobacteriota bacterium]
MKNIRGCPKCGSERVIKIVYGYPLEFMLRQERMGEIKLGGCIQKSTDPELFCKDCKFSFRKPVNDKFS